MKQPWGSLAGVASCRRDLPPRGVLSARVFLSPVFGAAESGGELPGHPWAAWGVGSAGRAQRGAPSRELEECAGDCVRGDIPGEGVFVSLHRPSTVAA